MNYHDDSDEIRDPSLPPFLQIGGLYRFKGEPDLALRIYDQDFFETARFVNPIVYKQADNQEMFLFLDVKELESKYSSDKSCLLKILLIESNKICTILLDDNWARTTQYIKPIEE